MDLQQKLMQILPNNQVSTRPIDLIAYSADASYFRLVPKAVVRPDSLSQIQALFEFGRQNQTPLTFRAAGTSLSGQSVSSGVIVDISRHWKSFSVENSGRQIRFQPGVIGGVLNRALNPYMRRIGPDPASIDAAMIGGILSNNSSGMCCGVIENSYQTIKSLKMILANGVILDTAAKDATDQFRQGAPLIYNGIMELKSRLLNAPLDSTFPGETPAQRVTRKYKSKNTNGYLVNSFLDFESPLEILLHLMIGSEGTLGFIAEGVLNTLPDYSHKLTGLLYFKNIKDAANAILPLRDSGARAAEIMDRAALRSVEMGSDMPGIIRELPESASAILVEYQAEDLETIERFQKEAGRVVKTLSLLQEGEFSTDPIQRQSFWKVRKEIVASVGAMRKTGTTCINEDIAFPVQSLASAITDLRQLFDDNGHPEGVIFGHAKDGNLHFLINQLFDTPGDLQHCDMFMQKIVHLVVDKYDGALKAEHGTGRNMAPFVQNEWGQEIYSIMRDIKTLFDPDGFLNPGVIINDNPEAHITDLRASAEVGIEVDKCIECGYCEPSCPSRFLTLSPRQRIVVQREIARLRKNVPDSLILSSLIQDYEYAGLETCAVDGLCASACPVGINTGELTKRLRAESVSSFDKKVAGIVVNNFKTVENLVGWGIKLGHVIDGITPQSNPSFLTSSTLTLEKLTSIKLPKWNKSVPNSSGRLLYTKKKYAGDQYQYVYFPSCISRKMGSPITEKGMPEPSLAETLLTLAKRAGIKMFIPEGSAGHCCGMPFSSKGFVEANAVMLNKTIAMLWEQSSRGKLQIVVDTTSCLYTLRECEDNLDDETKSLWEKLVFLDSNEFIYEKLLPLLRIHPVEENVVLHPNCSARKLGLDVIMMAIAKQCAKSVQIPEQLSCCGFAGDRGLLFPELTESATEQEASEVCQGDFDGHYSSNIPCEMGMSQATGRNYKSIAYLVEKASRLQTETTTE